MRVEADDFRRLTADSKRFGPELVKEMRRGLRTAAKPMADAAKHAILTMPTHGRESTGLRRRIARTVTIETPSTAKRAGVFITAKRSKMPVRERNLPQAIQRNRWRHPVFGNPGVWVAQRGRDWFDGPITSKAAAVDKAIIAALRAAERAIGFK